MGYKEAARGPAVTAVQALSRTALRGCASWRRPVASVCLKPVRSLHSLSEGLKLAVRVKKKEEASVSVGPLLSDKQEGCLGKCISVARVVFSKQDIAVLAGRPALVSLPSPKVSVSLKAAPSSWESHGPARSPRSGLRA